MLVELVCPTCGSELHIGQSAAACCRCGQEFKVVDGCIDFVLNEDKDSGERHYYDDTYAQNPLELTKDSLDYWTSKIWHSQTFPSGRDILLRLGDCRNKTILCLGNGTSLKEFYFAIKGASLWLSDLSLQAVRVVKALAESRFKGLDTQCHAIDAFHLPFQGPCFDIVYGFAFVHHLADKVSFLREVRRVLKPDGMCLFFDDAFSPLWHTAKTSLLRPVMDYVHKRRGISPEDLRATMEGGLTETQIRDLGVAAGFGTDYICIRRELLLYFWLRAMKKLFCLDEKNAIVASVGATFSVIDKFLASANGTYQDNTIRVVWGYRNT